MKGKIKKIVAIMCMAVLIVTMMPANIMTAKAASIKGTKIEVNQMYTGNLATADQVDWYTFDITQQGYFQVELGPQNSDDKNIESGWRITVYDQTENELKTVYDITSTTTTANLPFDVGTYFVKVSAELPYNSNAPIDCVYNLKVNTTESAAWESEYNDTMSKADVINPDELYRGTLYNAEDVDYFKVTTAKKGYFSVELAPENFGDSNIDNGWRITVYDQTENELKTVYDITSTTTTANLPFDVGNYFVKVSAELPYNSNAPIDCVYNLKVNTTESAAWESEYNDTMSKADVINPDELYRGTLYNAEDVDYFKVTTAKKGYFSVELAPENFGDSNIDNGWRITVYDQTENGLKTVYDITSTTTTANLPFDVGNYFVKVSAELPYNSNAPIDCVYNLKVNTVSSSIWESEKNDTKKTADKITLNKKNYYKGTSYHSTDEDFYKFTLPAKGKIKVSFKAEDFSELPSENFGWNLYVYNASGSKTYELGQIIQLKNKYLELNKGTYYMKVVPSTSSSWYAPVDVTYNFKVSYTKTPAKPTITKISSKKKTTTIKWKKVANATGYKVFAKVGKNGKYKVVKTIKNNKTVSFTHKKLKKGKTYYYKVQAYTTKNGMTTKSAQSKYKAIVVK